MLASEVFRYRDQRSRRIPSNRKSIPLRPTERTKKKTNCVSQSFFHSHFERVHLVQQSLFIMSILYYTINNSVFTNFAFYSTASLVKMMGMSLLTGIKRASKDVRFILGVGRDRAVMFFI